MKKSRICAIAALILTLVFLCTALIVPTLTKYIAEVNAPWGDEQNIDFTVDSMIEVTDQNELFSALNNGYPFIKLSKDIENPLIIMDEAQNLYHDLILDLNGIEIQRNGHDPILNIKSGVRLTVTDNSDEQTGGLYNPVGSVFNIDGGTLTVSRGTFESGPRYSEYYSYNSEMLDNTTGSTTKRTLVSGAQEVVYYTKGEANSIGTVIAPIIQSYPTETKDIIYNHGNIYFDEELTGIGEVKFTNSIKADTYCFYQTSEDAAYTSGVPKDADWYYTYYVKTATNTYYNATLSGSENESEYTQITIYGYENVIEEAAEKTDQSTYYAAIKMQAGSGKLDIQEGKFFSFFGVPTTAAVNAMGGSINVKTGEFSSRIPDAESITENAVTVKEDDFDAFNDTYFNNFKWANDSYTEGAIARQGEGYCILNSGDAEVNITQGKFYSSNNNIISMNGGSLTIGEGTFTKKNTIDLTADNNAKAVAVYMDDGVLSVNNAEFSVYGDYNAGVYMQNGKISIANSSCTIKGSHTYGIYSTVSGDDNFTVTDTDFTFTGIDGLGEVQIGLYAKNGKVSLSSSNGSTVSMSGTLSKAVYADDGSTVLSEGYKYNLTGDQSECIHSTGGMVEVSGGTIELSGASSAGIYSIGGDVDSSNVSLLLEGATSVGIYSTGGTVKAQNGCSITLTSNVSCYGIYAVSLDNTKAVNIEMDGATISVGDKVTVNSTSGSDKVGNDVLASVGAFLHSKNSASQITLNNSHIYSNEIGIAVNGGNLTCTGGGSVDAYNASAVVVKSGNVIFGSDNAPSNEQFTITSTINYDNATTRLKHAYKLQLQEITDSLSNPSIFNYDNNDGIYITDGTFTCHSGLNYTFTGLYNENQSNTTVYAPLKNLITSYAVYVSTTTAQADTTENFVMYKGSITSVYGGGIHVNGGNVILGNKNSTEENTNTLLSIITQGTAMYSTLNYDQSSGIDTWSYYVSQNGGHAVKVEGGNLDIYYGSYIAARGNALYITDGDVNVTKGNFVGGALPTTISENISQDDTNNTNCYTGYNGKSNGNSGLGCFYGLMLTNSGIVTVYDGNFLGQNGGAIFYGETSDKGCVADIQSGYFLSNKITDGFGGLTGLCGISICANTNLTLGAGVYVNAYNAAICIEYNTYLAGNYDNVNVTVNGGEYITSSTAVVFDGNTERDSSDTVISTRTKWTINGGHFQTASGSPIFNDRWGSYGGLWSSMLGAGYSAYYYNGTTYTDISNELSSDTSYNDVYVSSGTP